VAWRATRSERDIALASTQRIDAIKHSANSTACSGPRPRRHVRVAVDHPTTTLGKALDEFHVFNRVRRADFGSSCQTRHPKLDSVEQSGFSDTGQRRIEALGTLRMPCWSDVQIEFG
jgi:hypothetical protein